MEGALAVQSREDAVVLRLIAFGYAGWGPSQLEGELRRGSWFTAPAEPKLIFDEDRDKVWDLAFAQRTQDL